MINKLRCFECGDVIGMYHDSGAPFNHCYYCCSCGEQLEKDEEQEGDDE